VSGPLRARVCREVSSPLVGVISYVGDFARIARIAEISVAAARDLGETRDRTLMVGAARTYAAGAIYAFRMCLLALAGVILGTDDRGAR
jgi:hypothetical protein